jgi:hypothetical protein
VLRVSNSAKFTPAAQKVKMLLCCCCAGADPLTLICSLLTAAPREERTEEHAGFTPTHTHRFLASRVLQQPLNFKF